MDEETPELPGERRDLVTSKGDTTRGQGDVGDCHPTPPEEGRSPESLWEWWVVFQSRGGGVGRGETPKVCRVMKTRSALPDSGS